MELTDDIQVQIQVQAAELVVEGQWQETYTGLRIAQFKQPAMWGPVMAAKLAQPFIEPWEPTTPCHKGSAYHEVALLHTAGFLAWSNLAHDPFGGMSKFFGHALTRLASRCGHNDPTSMMQAAVPYVPDLLAGDSYRIALRASKSTYDRLDAVFPMVSNTWLARGVWPLFFSNLTLKKAWV